ncbi:MAG: ferredoxin [Desulfarculaceae bacterium]|nr:ferredoxin [Desulfarculaceae bacterium]MCF8072722.1 ferredoxin [Desulfarculaceae bacterium]MCF8102601.1 ferredoxin [Desulfarculaceae bacterium]MCF8116510.1 ferredoxin [Desulfarculaceae bacterium]
MRRPVVDMAACTMCEGCLDLAPEVFGLNQAGGYIEVAELEAYPEELVQEAVADCPAEAIAWEEA